MATPPAGAVTDDAERGVAADGITARRDAEGNAERSAVITRIPVPWRDFLGRKISWVAKFRGGADLWGGQVLRGGANFSIF